MYDLLLRKPLGLKSIAICKCPKTTGANKKAPMDNFPTKFRSKQLNDSEKYKIGLTRIDFRKFGKTTVP